MDKKRNKGFTLVELLIGLLILAILTAIIVPVTLHIINNSRETEAKTMAKNIMTAVQSGFNELAAYDEHWFSDQASKGLILNERRKNFDSKGFVAADFINGFIDVRDTYPIQNILKKIENADDVIFLYVGVGKVDKYYKNEKRANAYTAYFIVYQYKDADSPIYFYDGKNITKTSPLTKPKLTEDQSKYNFTIKSGKENIELQMYCLKKPDTPGVYDYWTSYVVAKAKEQKD